MAPLAFNLYQIKIVNWAKYNPRSDIKTSSWVRLQGNFLLDPVVSCLTNDQIVIFIYLLTRGGGSSEGIFKISLRLPSLVCKVSEKQILETLEILQSHNIIEFSCVTNADVTSTNVDVTHTCADVPYERNERNDTNGMGGTPPFPRTRTDGYPLSLPKSKVKKSKPIPILTERELAIATKWLEYSKREMPWKAEDPNWNVQSWAEALIEVKQKTDLLDEGLEKVLEFISQDHFWAKNAVSPKTLLVKSKNNGQRKIDNILVNLRTKGDRTREAVNKWAKDESGDTSITDWLSA